MTDETLHPLAQAYLQRLARVAKRLPRSQRGELVAEVRAHLWETAPPGSTEAVVRTAIDRLGTPEEIVGAAAPAQVPVAPGGGEWAATVLLLLGGFLCGIGWILGVVFLWTSRVWTLRDKLIGTLLLPGGLALVLLSAQDLIGGGGVCFDDDGHERCHGGSDTGSVLSGIALLLTVVVPIGTAIYLTVRARAAQARAAETVAV